MKKLCLKDFIHIGLFSALIGVCAWISIPLAVPVTLQTYGIFVAVGLLGGLRGSLAVAVYVLLGAAGLPVFSNFGAGPGVLLGPTGGYILGFLLSAPLMGLWLARFGKGPLSLALAMGLGLLLCYVLGTAWFLWRYTGERDLLQALRLCVFPFLLPDGLKIALAVLTVRRLGKALGLQ